MSTSDLLPELAAWLEEFVPRETSTGDWDDVLRRTRAVAPARRQKHGFAVRIALAVVLFVLLAGIATATYFALRHNSGPRPRPTPGALTVITGGYSLVTPARIVQVLPDGRLRVVWRCPAKVCGGEMRSADWAPDGRHLALILDAFNFTGAYLGLHVIDTQTGRDVHFGRTDDSRLGCEFPASVAWSPDGQRLAYACGARFEGVGRTVIMTIASDGTGRQQLPTGNDLVSAGWPTWSPDGERLAFQGIADKGGSPSIYVMRLDGSDRLVVARNAWKPDWSPDGTKIAYRATDGIRYVTPSGKDVTPPGANGTHTSIRPRGLPAWSPTGSTLAIATRAGVWLVPAAGGQPKLATDAGAQLRPAWYPVPNPPHITHAGRHGPFTTTCEDC